MFIGGVHNSTGLEDTQLGRLWQAKDAGRSDEKEQEDEGSRFGEPLVQFTRYPWLFPVSAYVVREADGFTLIDTGLSGSEQEILEVAGRYGGQVRRIALTHAHVDHTGSFDALPEAEVLMTAREARLLGGELALEQGEPGELRGSWGTAKTGPTRELAVWDRIGSLEVVASPGHVSFLDVRDRTLIAGDAFQTRAGTAVSGIVRPLFPFPALATWHLPTALESARALRALEPSRLAVGHGPVLEDSLPAIDRAIEVAGRKVGDRSLRAARGVA